MTAILIIFYLNFNRTCKIARKYYEKMIGKKTEKKEPKKFYEVFPSNALKDYLSSYRLEENPLYSSICYTMTILNMFGHLFISKP